MDFLGNLLEKKVGILILISLENIRNPKIVCSTKQTVIHV